MEFVWLDLYSLLYIVSGIRVARSLYFTVYCYWNSCGSIFIVYCILLVEFVLLDLYSLLYIVSGIRVARSL